MAQQSRIVARCEEWKATLTERGITGKTAARNPTLRKLQADVRRARRRIAAMEAAAAHVKSVIEKGEEVKVKPEKKAAAKKGADKKAAGAAKPDKPAKAPKKK
ncbi:MAG TPA: hypothetical protein VM285_00560 [Polyangia bacterium]|nr:hypothetical protein [Polyangia bacterium]